MNLVEFKARVPFQPLPNSQLELDDVNTALHRC